jgi:hypothetical protein
MGFSFSFFLFSFFNSLFLCSGWDPVTPSNLDEWLLAYDATMQLRLDWYKEATPDFFLFPWGGDFLFYNATKEFSNMDRLLSAVGKRNAKMSGDVSSGAAASLATSNRAMKSTDGRSIRASKPSKLKSFASPSYSCVPDFFAELSTRAPHLNLTTRSGEDLPYDWPLDTYWSGFFSSRATLKGAIRHVCALVAATDLFYVLAKTYETKTFQLVRENVSLILDSFFFYVPNSIDSDCSSRVRHSAAP